MLKFCLYFTILFFSSSAFSENLEKPVSALKSVHKEARDSQKKINKLDDESKKLIQAYRRTLNKTENIRIYNEQLSSYIEGQQGEILEIRRKIEEVKDTGKEIVPLMLRMLDSLDQFILLDIPFYWRREKSVFKS